MKLLSLLITASLVQFWIFFHSDSFIENFGANNPSYIPEYIQFSRGILNFDQPMRNGHWGESLLIPILGEILGANKTVLGYKLLTISFYLLLMPALAGISYQTTKNYFLTIAFIVVFAFTFGWINQYNVIFPDSLTILCLSIAAIISSPILVGAFIFIATLSHFSITLIATLTLIPLFYASVERKNNLLKIKYALLGLLMGRILLQLWFYLYDYKSSTVRIDWVKEKGLEYFFDLYEKGPLIFWLTPKTPLLLALAVVVLILAIKKQYFLIFFALIALLINYLVLFFTMDGFRIFITTFSPVYTYLIFSSCSLVVIFIQSRLKEKFSRGS